MLAPGGRGVVREPVRNSRTAAALRRLVPYRHPDVSPFEHPLRDADISAFASVFDAASRRHFELSLTRMATLLNLSSRAQTRLRASDHRALERWPWLRAFAAMAVLEVRVQSASSTSRSASSDR